MQRRSFLTAALAASATAITLAYRPRPLQRASITSSANTFSAAARRRVWPMRTSAMLSSLRSIALVSVLSERSRSPSARRLRPRTF